MIRIEWAIKGNMTNCIGNNNYNLQAFSTRTTDFNMYILELIRTPTPQGNISCVIDNLGILWDTKVLLLFLDAKI